MVGARSCLPRIQATGGKAPTSSSVHSWEGGSQAPLLGYCDIPLGSLIAIDSASCLYPASDAFAIRATEIRPAGPIRCVNASAGIHSQSMPPPVGRFPALCLAARWPLARLWPLGTTCQFITQLRAKQPFATYSLWRQVLCGSAVRTFPLPLLALALNISSRSFLFSRKLFMSLFFFFFFSLSLSLFRPLPAAPLNLYSSRSNCLSLLLPFFPFFFLFTLPPSHDITAQSSLVPPRCVCPSSFRVSLPPYLPVSKYPSTTLLSAPRRPPPITTHHNAGHSCSCWPGQTPVPCGSPRRSFVCRSGALGDNKSRKKKIQVIQVTSYNL